MRYDRLDDSIDVARTFLQSAEKLRKACREERRAFPDHKHIDITHARQVAVVRSLSKELSNFLTKLRQAT